MRLVTLAALLLAPLALAAATFTHAEAFPPGTRYVPAPLHAPSYTSYAFVEDWQAGTASPPLPIVGPGAALIWIMPVAADGHPAGLLPGLSGPSGLVLATGADKSADLLARRERFVAPDLGLTRLENREQNAIFVERTKRGVYSLSFPSVPMIAGAHILVAEPQSDLLLSAWASPLSRQAGEPVILHAELFDGDQAVTGAAVTAQLAPPQGEPLQKRYVLLDDGEHRDGAAKDGVYGAVLDDMPALPGLWNVRLDASGVTAGGATFRRTVSAGFFSEPATARFTAAPTATVEGDVLRIAAQAEIASGGSGVYRLEAIRCGREPESLPRLGRKRRGHGRR